MTDLVEELYKLTDDLYNHLQKKPDKDQREEFIERINYFLVEREKVIDRFKQYNITEISLTEEFKVKDKEIGQIMQAILIEIQEDIKQITHLKMIKKQYEINNNRINADGMFFDKRK